MPRINLNLKERTRIAKRIMDSDNLEYSCKGIIKEELSIKQLIEENNALKKQIKELQERNQKPQIIQTKAQIFK